MRLTRRRTGPATRQPLQCKARFEKELIGKDESDLYKAPREIKEALTAQCEKLHKSGGLIKVTDNSGKIPG